MVGKLIAVSFVKNLVFHKCTFGLTLEGTKRKECRKSATVLWADDMTENKFGHMTIYKNYMTALCDDWCDEPKKSLLKMGENCIKIIVFLFSV